MAAPRSIDRQTFLARLRQSRLVGDEQLARIAARFAATPGGRDVAAALVEDGTLTWFQAARLFEGRTAGFDLGPYRILEQIGRGGTGRVYKAEHRTLKRIVALKIVAGGLLDSEEAVGRFLHEVRAAGGLAHPNIVTAYDANEINGRYYLVLEYVDGPNLDQLVRKQGPLSVGLACDYVRQAAAALACAHHVGMLHRDVKPANLLVQWHGLAGEGSPGLVKVSDFGLARLARPAAGEGPRPTILVKENTVLGTPDFLSPEQSRDVHQADIRSDLYSLGCTFYYLLTGEVPFPGGGPIDKVIRHATEAAKPIRATRADVPSPVSAVVEKLMAKAPEGRYQTPAALTEALRPYAVSGPTPWAPQRPPAAVFLDRLPAPTGQKGPVDDLVSDNSDAELAAMTALTPTLSGAASPTPLAVPRREPPRPTEDRLRVALFVAIGVVGIAVLVLVLLSR